MQSKIASERWILYGCMLLMFGTTMASTTIAISLLVVSGLVTSGITTIPHGMRNGTKVQLMLFPTNILTRVDNFLWKVGVGPLFQFIRFFQTPIKLEGSVASNKHGDILAERKNIAGIPVIIYRPKNMPTDVLSPALIFLHGGGFCNLSADTCDETVYHYSSRTRLIAISVDFKRAPQHPFPEPLEDCKAVVQDILRNGHQLGIDATKVCLIGESSGATMAASITLMLTRENQKLDIAERLPPLKCQILHYPTLQIFDFQLPSLTEYSDFNCYATAQGLACYWCHYLGLGESSRLSSYISCILKNRHVRKSLRYDSKFTDYFKVDRLPPEYREPKFKPLESAEDVDEELAEKLEPLITDPRVSPLLADDLSGQPSTFLHVAEFDVMRDDGLLYYSRLSEAGVEVELFFGKNGFHCDTVRILPEFLHPDSGEEAQEAACEFLRKMFDIPNIPRRNSSMLFKIMQKEE